MLGRGFGLGFAFGLGFTLASATEGFEPETSKAGDFTHCSSLAAGAITCFSPFWPSLKDGLTGRGGIGGGLPSLLSTTPFASTLLSNLAGSRRAWVSTPVLIDTAIPERTVSVPGSAMFVSFSFPCLLEFCSGGRDGTGGGGLWGCATGRLGLWGISGGVVLTELVEFGRGTTFCCSKEEDEDFLLDGGGGLPTLPSVTGKWKAIITF